MKCPKDNTELIVDERHGIEIDHCPTCRGVWLDRGELDKILEHGTHKNGTNQDNSAYGDLADGAGFLGDLFNF